MRPTLAAATNSTAVRYVVFGGFAFVVDFGLLALGYRVIGLPLEAATGAAFLISFFFTFAVQRFFAFRSVAPQGRSLFRYAILVVLNTFATVVIVWVVDAAGAGWVVGKVAATLASTVWNYFAYRHWVFGEGSTTVV